MDARLEAGAAAAAAAAAVAAAVACTSGSSVLHAGSVHSAPPHRSQCSTTGLLEMAGAGEAVVLMVAAEAGSEEEDNEVEGADDDKFEKDDDDDDAEVSEESPAAGKSPGSVTAAASCFTAVPAGAGADAALLLVG